MRHEKLASLQEYIKTASMALSLIVAIAGVVVSLFNLLTLNKLAPLTTRLDSVEASDRAVAEELRQHERDSAASIEKFATKEQVEQLQRAVTTIGNRVEFIYRDAYTRSK